MDQTSPTRRRRRKEARPEEILGAALEELRRARLRGDRIEDVAQRPASAGTLYLYFPSKEELFKAVVRSAVYPTSPASRGCAGTFEGPAGPARAAAADGRGRGQLPRRRDPEARDRRGRQFSGSGSLLSRRGGASRPRADRAGSSGAGSRAASSAPSTSTSGLLRDRADADRSALEELAGAARRGRAARPFRRWSGPISICSCVASEAEATMSWLQSLVDWLRRRR